MRISKVDHDEDWATRTMGEFGYGNIANSLIFDTHQWRTQGFHHTNPGH